MDLSIAPFAAMNDRDPPSQLAPGVWAFAQNAICLSGSPSAPVKIRPGTPLLSSTAFGQSPCQGLFAWKGASGLGTMTAGSHTLTLASMSAIAAGDAISVEGAGSADGTLTLYTTVASIGSWSGVTGSGTVTLADPCLATGGVLYAKAFDPGIPQAIYAGTSHLYASGAPTTPLTVNLIGGLGMGAWAASNLFQFAYSNGQVYIVNGLNSGYGTNWRYNGDGLYPMGCKAPTAAPTGSASGPGVLTGNYGYVFTYYDPEGDRESDPSPPLWFVTQASATASQVVTLVFRDAAHPLGILTNFQFSSGVWTKETAPGSGIYSAGGFGRNTQSKLNAMVDEVNPSEALSYNQTKVHADACPDPTFTAIRWYRTQADGDKYFSLAEVDPGDYTDNVDDDSLDDLNEVGDAGENKDTIGEVACCIAALSDGRVVIANMGPGALRQIWAAYDVDYPESFPDSGQTSAGDENGAQILCMVPLNNRLCVVCEDSIWVLDPTCTQCTESDDTVGGVGRWCAQGTPYGVLFVGWSGIYLFSGQHPVCISHCIDGTWGKVQKGRLPWVATAYDSTSEHFMAAVCLTPGGNVNDTIIALDCRTLGSEAGPRFSLWPMPVEAMSLLRESGTTWGKGSLVCRGNGQVCRFDDTDTWRADAGGIAIPFEMISGGLSHLNKDQERDFKHNKMFEDVYTEIEAP